MWPLIHNADLKRLFGGAAIAVVAGLAMGAAMRPNFDVDAIEGPQQLLGRSGVRTYAVADDPGVAAYGSRLPDYVIGADALQPPQLEVLAYEDRAESAPAATDEAYGAAATDGPVHRWVDEPSRAVRYPSEHGDIFGGSDEPADEPSDPA